MKPGRELDALVAEKVMGQAPEVYWVAVGDDGGIYLTSDSPALGSRGAMENWLRQIQADGLTPDARIEERHRYPRYSTSIADAWQVVERLTHNGWSIAISASVDGSHDAIAEKGGQRRVGFACSTAPYAICLAALQAHP